MKISYKIITTFIIILFTALFITNLSLKAKYAEGDFNVTQPNKDDIFKQGDLDKKKLGNFKHLVINGAIITKNNREVRFNPIFLISSGNTGNILGIKKNLNAILKTQILNDTLYISFQKNTINEDNLRKAYFNRIIIQTKDLQSVNAKNTECAIESIISGKPFSLTAESTYLNFGYINTNLLTLNIGTKSNITINGYGTVNTLANVAPKIANLNYTLGQGSSITIANKDLIEKINCLTPSKNIVEDYSKSLNIFNNSKL